MKSLSYTLATIAIVGFSLLPANALEKEINNKTIIPDATEQVKQSTQSQQASCWFGNIWIC